MSNRPAISLEDLAKRRQEQLEARTQDVERGRLASLARGYLSDPIESAQQDCVKRLIHAYRARETTHDVLVGIAAELSMLDKLMSDMITEVQRGDTAMMKEHDYAENR